MVKVKICGITSLEDALAACEYGADYLGFIFVEGTPRFTAKDKVVNIAGSIPKSLRSGVLLTGLFKDAPWEEVVKTVIACGIDMVQLQGQETPSECAKIKKKTGIAVAKAIKVGVDGITKGKYSLDDYAECDYFVFDTFHPEMSGGTGTAFNWKALASECSSIDKPFFVAGGLNPENVAMAVNILKPYGVDVSSGVEKAVAKKDKKMLKEFIENAKAKQTAR